MHVAHAEDPAYGLSPAVLRPAHLERRPRPGGHIGVAGGVHDDLGRNDLASTLRLNHNPLQDCSIQEDISEERMQEELDVMLRQHLEEHVAEHLRIGLRHGAAEWIGDVGCGRLEGNEAIEELLGNATDGLAALPIQEAEIGHPRARHAADLAVLLDEESVGSRAAGGDGCNSARCSPADHNHLNTFSQARGHIAPSDLGQFPLVNG